MSYLLTEDELGILTIERELFHISFRLISLMVDQLKNDVKLRESQSYLYDLKEQLKNAYIQGNSDQLLKYSEEIIMLSKAGLSKVEEQALHNLKKAQGLSNGNDE